VLHTCTVMGARASVDTKLLAHLLLQLFQICKSVKSAKRSSDAAAPC